MPDGASGIPQFPWMKFPTRTFSSPVKEHRRLKQVEPNSPSLSKRRLRSSLTISKPPSCYLRTTICLTLRSARFWDALQKPSKRDFIVSGSSLRSGWQRSFKLIRLALHLLLFEDENAVVWDALRLGFNRLERSLIPAAVCSW